jgi:hypothetical protein
MRNMRVTSVLTLPHQATKGKAPKHYYSNLHLNHSSASHKLLTQLQERLSIAAPFLSSHLHILSAHGT